MQQKQGKHIDFDKLNDLILDGYTTIQDAKDKTGVLMLGNTSSGKSTLVNYLIGCKMKKTKVNGKFVIEIEPTERKQLQHQGKRYAKIGHQFTMSETIYPEGYYNEQYEIYLCDLAGFGDTRGIEEKICSQMLTEIAVKSLNSIHSIVVVISYSDIEGSKGKKFSDLCDILGNLLPNVDNEELSLQESIIFVITKVNDDYNAEDIKNSIQNIIGEQRKKINMTDEQYTQIQGGYIYKSASVIKSYRTSFVDVAKKLFVGMPEEKIKEIEEIQKFIKFLELILKCQMFVADVLKLDSRDQIMSALKVSKPIPIAQIDMKYYDDTTRNEFYNSVFQIVDEGAKLIGQKINLDTVQKRQIQQFSVVESTTALISSLENLEIEMAKQQMLKEIKQQEEATIQEMKKDQDKIQKLIEQLSTDDKISHWQQSFHERWKLFEAVKRTFGSISQKEQTEFNYQGPPIADVRIAGTNGEFDSPQYNYKEGRYSIKFQYFSGIGATAFVEIFVKKKDLPDNQLLLRNLQESQAKLSQDIQEIMAVDHDALINSFMFLLKLVKRNIFYVKYIIKASQTKQFEEQLDQLQKVRNETKAQQELVLKQLKENSLRYQTIRRISDIIDFNSELVKNFCKLYEQEHQSWEEVPELKENKEFNEVGENENILQQG